jgi:Na+/proline symporter/signal transduction histidine kinase/CheY-like chemotaxis protein
MFSGTVIAALAVCYVGILFAIAWVGDRTIRSRKGGGGRPLLYALSLGVYCTSWTFFGSVGLSSATGYDFIPVYLGPILVFLFGWPLILRIVRLAKSQNITSVADFLAARYGKSQSVAAIVTVVSVLGTLPYIALQLKAIVISTETLLGGSPLVPISLPSFGPIETAMVATAALAVFAILFGTRHIDATEHQDGLMLAVATESVVKLAAFMAVGVFVVFFTFGSPATFLEQAQASSDVQRIFGRPFDGGRWLTVVILSSIAILLLPRQFHVTVVESNSEREIKRAAWLFPLYLVLINLFVVPIAAAGLLSLPRGLIDPDMFVLALPMAKGADYVTVLAFIGGLSAATAMVIVESVALSIMVCNGIVVPLLLRQGRIEPSREEDVASHLLRIRRVAICLILLLGYLVYRALGQSHGLAAIGLVAFAAIAQLGPAFFGGLMWRGGTARGAIAGILAGFLIWGYTLLLPWVVKAGFLPESLVGQGPFGIALLKPQALFFIEFEPLAHGVFWSLAANVVAYVFVSALRSPEPVERLQAHVFVGADLPRAAPAPGFRLWGGSIPVASLQATVARYLGAERAERSFREYQLGRGIEPTPHAEADIETLRFTEHLLTSAIGAASSRLVLSLLLRRANVGSRSALRLLDDASEALQYNRDLLQSALDQVRHGLSVFDKDLQLICWNRQFRELLRLPEDLGRVGVPLERILRYCAERGDFGLGDPGRHVEARLQRLAVRRATYQEPVVGTDRILEVRTAAMPQGGFVSTFSDITERVTAAEALARANETLERRVRERTGELLEVNEALAVAKAKADTANIEKTRFLAAASHDLLQPLNAARLYASSLVERPLADAERAIARNIDASLVAVEEILGALIEISRMDAGRVEAEFADVALNDFFEQLEVEFEPLARERGLELRVVATSLWVRTDRRLVRRVLQNLVSNAIKYTSSGGVVLGARRRGGTVVVQVTDSGRGIALADRALVFKEFERVPEAARQARGLGLGLSIVERISKVLDAPVRLDSKVGRGSTFTVTLPRSSPQRRAREALPASRAAGTLEGLVVLSIDNEPAVLEGMRTLLEGWRCTVLTAAGAEDAAAAVRRLGRAPDVILADYHLDSGTGIDAIDVVRATTGREVPAVVITADHSGEVHRDLRLRGLAVLRKPVRAAALRSILAQHLMQRAAAAE